jgi:hypothetical protein
LINASQKQLKIISAIFIIAGGIILFIKGYLMLKDAISIKPDIEIISLVMASAFIVGLLKNKFIMTKFNLHNIDRINNMENPKLYDFFELKFFFYLGLMIIAGIVLSGIAEGDYNLLLIVGGIDLALSTALLKSSILFFNEKKS